MIMNRVLEFDVESSDDSISVRDYIRNKIGISSALISHLKRPPSGIFVNDEPVHTNHVLRYKDHLKLVINEETVSSNIVPTEGHIEIIFENEDVLIINKPPFLPCHPSKGHFDDTLANYVAYYYSDFSDSFVFRCITRLDRDTSGLVVIAKNAFAQYEITKQMYSDQLNKEYLALVHGAPDNYRGVINKNIRRIPNTNTIKREVCSVEEGQSAVTEYTLLRKFGDYSLLSVSTLTGRTHQIRVHLKSIGHPLLGDWLYGESSKEYPRQMLHCFRLSLCLPFSGEKKVFEAPLPLDFKNKIGS